MTDLTWPKHKHGAMKGCFSVRGVCPACGAQSLALGVGGHVTCANLSCPDPAAADALLNPEAVVIDAPEKADERTPQ